MEIVGGQMTVTEFCQGLAKNEIQVDHRYQRSHKVWPAPAQVFLIESILLGFPIPALFIYQKTDRVSKKTVRYIVDGQQRSVAIRSFYEDELRLSKIVRDPEATGRKYSELPENLQDRFLSYGLDVQQFVNTTEEEVREVFRRINSYEVPLNAEEQRHAKFQGEFKWFVYQLSHELDNAFLALHTFSETQLVRMQDMKLLAEISHALIHGITTTNKRSLDAAYRDNDETFDQAKSFTSRIQEAFDYIVKLEGISGSFVTSKAYSLYSLVLAAIHVRRNVHELEKHHAGGGGLASKQTAEHRLSRLIEAAEADQPPKSFAAFARAIEKGTNVRQERITRFSFYCDALRKDGGSKFKS